MYARVSVCVYACMLSVSVYACMCVRVHARMSVCISHLLVSVYVCMCVRVHARMSVYMSHLLVSVHVCMCVRGHARMSVCISLSRCKNLFCVNFPSLYMAKIMGGLIRTYCICT